MTLQQIDKSFDLELQVLKKVDLTIKQGDFLGIVGQSGSGKTTLISIIGLLDKVFDGRYLLEDVDVASLTRDQATDIRNQQIGFVFQNFGLIETMNALDNISLPLLYSKHTVKEARQKALELLERVGLADKANSLVTKLSGGQRQRVAIARALVNQPKFIIADEPTGALDSRTSADIMQLFVTLNAEGTTIIMVTHDLELTQYCNKVVTMKDGVLSHAD
ncbi:MAG: ABC transporter ATP-binding protein [Streptococcaceae bacterium]|jgi:putative ABC transport system ATP-binding protein|nr:ABC transporter ATP-binding protein [Streptococcaceae bacterium]